MCEKGKERPPLFKALGDAEPPFAIIVNGGEYELERTMKHDSWAATAVYRMGDHRIVCKFNRTQRIFGLPTAWLGKRLAAHELMISERLAGIPSIAEPVGPVLVRGKAMSNAFAREYVDGRTLREHGVLPTSFFDEMERQLALIHAKGVCIIDLNKEENIIVATDGKVKFIDFQISGHFPPSSRFPVWRWLFGPFARSDNYHLFKHRLNHSATISDDDVRKLSELKGPCHRLHDFIVRPLIRLRRKLLVALGIRRHSGLADSEHFVEEGKRGARSDSMNQ